MILWIYRNNLLKYWRWQWRCLFLAFHAHFFYYAAIYEYNNYNNNDDTEKHRIWRVSTLLIMNFSWFSADGPFSDTLANVIWCFWTRRVKNKRKTSVYYTVYYTNLINKWLNDQQRRHGMRSRYFTLSQNTQITLLLLSSSSHHYYMIWIGTVTTPDGPKQNEFVY